MHLSIEIFVVTLFATVIMIAAVTRTFSRYSGVSFTIMMLLFGLIGGLLIRNYTDDHGVFSYFHQTADHHILSPHLILFVFLPILIFDSAFSLEAHIFRKQLTNIALLAGPAIVLTTVLTAYLIISIEPGSWQWTLPLAFVFGALINATDPVAVVALLRDLGISKRLVTLIEGESLLNDGTAIVLFTVFMQLAVGAESFSFSNVLIELCRVVLGGLLIGWVLAQFFSRWIGLIFNDPLVEITLTMVLAYLAMILAEAVFHVSGVMALVVAGLYMSTMGRTRISPEVMTFLHEFWSMLAYIANSLIFFLVGLVIAIQLQVFYLKDLWIAIVAYIGLMLIRFCAVFIFRPIFSLLGNPLEKDRAMIVSWGGLRGAVSLALALMLSQTQSLPESFRQQALLLTAVIVVLTVVLNGSTMKTLLRILKLDKPTISAQLSSTLAQLSILSDVKNKLEEMARSSGFRNVFWSEVRMDVNQSYDQTKALSVDLNKKLMSTTEVLHELEFWYRALNIERTAYWELFSQGILSRRAVAILTHELDLQQDLIRAGKLNVNPQRTPESSQWTLFLNSMFRRYQLLKQYFGSIIFEELKMQFYCFHAEGYAAGIVLKNLNSMEGMHKATLEKITKTYNGYIHRSKERLELMRTHLPEMSRAIETYFARRLILNHERIGVNKLMAAGIIEESIGEDTLHDIEERMYQLEKMPRFMKLPTIPELIKEVSIFKLCSTEELQEISKMFVEQVILQGEYLFHENEASDSLYIIVRGAIEIRKNSPEGDEILTILGGGEIVGEMALLTGQPRMASAIALTTVTVLKMIASDFKILKSRHKGLVDNTWLAYGRHTFHNLRHQLDDFKDDSPEKIQEIISRTTIQNIEMDADIHVPMHATHLLVLWGSAAIKGKIYQSNTLVRVHPGEQFHSTGELHLLWIYTRGNVVFQEYARH